MPSIAKRGGTHVALRFGFVLGGLPQVGAFFRSKPGKDGSGDSVLFATDGRIRRRMRDVRLSGVISGDADRLAGPR